MATFDTWTVAEAKKQINKLVPTWAKTNQKYYDGDHWQTGDGWSGPLVESTDSAYGSTLLKIEKGFVSKNVIAEVVDRHTAGVVGKRPKWTVDLIRTLDEGQEPNAEEQNLIDEAEELLATWLNGRQATAPRQSGDGVRLTTVHEALQQAVTSALLTRRGVLRLFVNPAALEVSEAGDTAVATEEAVESIRKIFVAHADSTGAAVITDPDTLQSCGVYVYKDLSLTEQQGQELAELTYITESGETAVTIANIRKGENGQAVDGGRLWLLPLGGRLLMYEMLREELISEQVRQAQKALNKAKTMQSYNLDGAGFLERIFTNAQMPGTWSTDSDGNEVFTPGRFNTGAATVNFLSGIETTNTKTGETSLTTPGVHYREPSSPENFIKSSDDYYRGILDEVDQLHHLIAGDAAASGVARQTAKDDFRASLDLTRPQVEGAMRWLLETVLTMTAVFSGQPGRYDSLKVTAQARIDLGTITADELRVTGEARSAGLISQQTAVSRAGVDDVQAEIDLISQETMAQLAILEQQAKVIELLWKAGASIEGAAEVVGIEPSLARKLAGRRLIPAGLPTNGAVNAPT